MAEESCIVADEPTGKPRPTLNAVDGARYMAAVGAGVLLGILSFAAILFGLGQTGNLPPPPVANSICIDEKLAFLRDRMPAAPNLLVIGSSVAWRQFDGDAATAGTRPLNAGFCHQNASQSASVAPWLIRRLPTVHNVLMITAPQDFQTCTGIVPAFDLEDADRFVFERAWRWGFYVRFFDPVSLWRNAWRVAARRTGVDPADALLMTKYGDGPLNTQLNQGLLYGPISKLDQACFASLRILALTLQRDGKQFFVAMAPLHPGWKGAYDPQGELRNQFERGIDLALQGTGARYWNGDEAAQLDASAFYDAIHLRWSAVRNFSEMALRVFDLQATQHRETTATRGVLLAR